jgi:hypothetical protein
MRVRLMGLVAVFNLHRTLAVIRPFRTAVRTVIVWWLGSLPFGVVAWCTVTCRETHVASIAQSIHCSTIWVCAVDV